MFKRKIEKILLDYYNSKEDKIIIVKGARQVGKSFIIRKTASNFFSNYVEIDLKSDYEGKKLFQNAKTTKDFYLILSSIHGDKMNSYDDTIIFLDEIQFYPHLITLLKDLHKEKRFRYIASGSLLGVTLKHIFIPMGAINEIKMFPMDFEEFLWANGIGNEITEYLEDCFKNLKPINDSVHIKMIELFQDYLISGGLPDAVTEYVINKNVIKTRKIHELIFNYYRDDCSRYSDNNKLAVMRVYNMIISNMCNKVKRLQFKKIEDKLKATYDTYQDEFDYLISSGVSLGVKAVSNPIFPLVEASSKNLIKLYYNDVGILTNLLYKNNISAILEKDKGVNLGSVYETVVAMELIAHGHELFYFDRRKIGEVDFLFNDYNSLSVIPIEIKSGKDRINYRAIPKLVDKKESYKLKYGYIFGNKNIVLKEKDLIKLPIYMVMFI